MRRLKRDNYWLELILGLGLGMRLIKINMPLLVRTAGRELITADVTKALYFDEFNIFHLHRFSDPLQLPFVLEFPTYNLLTGWLYWLTGGVNEIWGRLISVVASLLAAVVLYKLARSYFSERASLLTVGFFYLLSPVAIWMSRAFQPDSLTLALGLTAVYLLRQWQLSGARKELIGSAICFGLAGLTKLPVVFLAVPGLFMFWEKNGLAGWRKLEFWIYWSIGLLPIFAWYVYAIWMGRGLLELTGANSWTGFNWRYWNRLGSYKFWVNNFYNFGYEVVTPVGLILLLWGAALKKWVKRARVFLVWILAGWVAFLIVPNITISHYYYYYLLLPAVAIFIGLGADSLIGLAKQQKILVFPWLMMVIVLSLIALGNRNVWLQQYRIAKQYQRIPELVKIMKRLIPENGWVLTFGEASLYYGGRKGFNLPFEPQDEQQMIKTLNKYHDLGIEYLILERVDLLQKIPEFDRYINKYQLLTDADKPFRIYHLSD